MKFRDYPRNSLPVESEGLKCVLVLLLRLLILCQENHQIRYLGPFIFPHRKRDFLSKGWLLDVCLNFSVEG